MLPAVKEDNCFIENVCGDFDLEDFKGSWKFFIYIYMYLIVIEHLHILSPGSLIFPLNHLVQLSLFLQVLYHLTKLK